MKRVGCRAPFWVMRTGQLRGASKRFNLKMEKGSAFRIVFVDMGEAISEIKLRPLFVRQEEETKKIWARFDLFDPFTKEKIPVNLVYHEKLGAFVLELPGSHVFLATSYPDVDYYDDDKRDDMTRLLNGEEPRVNEEGKTEQGAKKKEEKPCREKTPSSTARSRSERSSSLEIREPSARVVRTLFSE